MIPQHRRCLLCGTWAGYDGLPSYNKGPFALCDECCALLRPSDQRQAIETVELMNKVVASGISQEKVRRDFLNAALGANKAATLA